MSDCLFCKIINGEIPSYKIYEDEHFVAILDRFPKCVGHVLILSKVHTPDLFGLPDEAASALMPLAKRLSAKMRDELKFDGFNVLQNNGQASGQQVMHYHLHLIPRFDGDDMSLGWKPLDPKAEEFEAIMARLKG